MMERATRARVGEGDCARWASRTLGRSHVERARRRTRGATMERAMGVILMREVVSLVDVRGVGV